MERHMRTTLALVIAGLLAATIASTWVITQSDAELAGPAMVPVTTLSPIDMMKNVNDLPVTHVSDFI
jgi:hypothetical protein